MSILLTGINDYSITYISNIQGASKSLNKELILKYLWISV